MKTELERINDEVVKEFGYFDYRDFVRDMDDPQIIIEIAKRYAIACIKASLEEAANNATTSQEGWSPHYVNKSSITNDKNIKLL